MGNAEKINELSAKLTQNNKKINESVQDSFKEMPELIGDLRKDNEKIEKELGELQRNEEERRAKNRAHTSIGFLMGRREANSDKVNRYADEYYFKNN